MASDDDNNTNNKSNNNSIFPSPQLTRLVTIIAQVDHGKTTLADSLIESNGIISERLAGKLRYLDSLKEEQRRGITMKTSAIALQHVSTKKKKKKQQQTTTTTVIHLLDSPGHADFSPQVSSALQLCDGALLVVDAVEGLCARTHQVLREAFMHSLVPILVINKVDRLCTELCQTSSEAYLRLLRLIESVNAACAAMLMSSVGGGDDNDTNDNDEHENQHRDNEELWTFTPAKGNVVFCSALHGWGFTIPSLARTLFRNNVIDNNTMKPVVLRQWLFGDFKYKNGKVLKWKGEGDDVLPLFAQYALEPIWQIYQNVEQASAVSNNNNNKKITADTMGMDQVQAAMGDELDLQEILKQTGSSTHESVLSAVLRRFRPLSTAVLDAVCDKCPSPDEASLRIRTSSFNLHAPVPNNNNNNNNVGWDSVQKAVHECRIDNDAPTVAQVCKFMPTPRANIQNAPDANGENTFLLGVARVLSGTLTSDASYHIFGPKYHNTTAAQDEEEVPQRRTIRLYLMMGSSLLQVPTVPAGHLCAIYGLEDLQLKTVTLSSSKDCMPLVSLSLGVRPLVKVHVEPQDPSDTDALEQGLLKLSLADAAVDVTATAKGERILACLGEIHLEQSLLDLATVYCEREIKLRNSEPIVDFGETTDWLVGEEDYGPFLASCRTAAPLRQVTIPPYSEEEGIRFARQGRARALLTGKSTALGIRVLPLEKEVFDCIQSKKLEAGSEGAVLRLGNALGCKSDDATAVLRLLTEATTATDAFGNALIESSGLRSGRFVRGFNLERVYTGEKEDEVGKDEAQELFERIRREGLLLDAKDTTDVTEWDVAALQTWKSQLSGSITAGFQIALRSGPVCEEPVHRILVCLESVEMCVSQHTSAKSLSGGMVISAMKQGIRCALLSRTVMLMERQLKLTLHSSLAGLGSLHAVLQQRRGKVIEDTMVEGTDLLLITASLPQVESYGLAPEILSKSSGQVTVPELEFDRWQRLDMNPFWTPKTADELEDFDQNAWTDNTALKCIRLVRARKGLLVDSAKTVVAAEKQRTVKR